MSLESSPLLTLPSTFYTVESPQRFPNASVLWSCPSMDTDPASSMDEQVLRLLRDGAIDGPQSLCLAYAGHQFGQFVPTLGDGRAHVLGDLIGPRGERRELQLKGSGRTLFSRGGDGRATLGAVLREILVSASLHAMGVATTRGVAAYLTGDRISRGHPRPGAVLVRSAASHLRVGTFQYFACRDDGESVRRLTEYAIDRHDPDLRGGVDRFERFFERVVLRQAALIASWQSVGFIHGVLNTDNVAISGETLDFGPCAFLDEYEPGQVFSSIDQHGRYAYEAQPDITVWNLARLAECLLPLIDARDDTAVEKASDLLGRFRPAFEAEHRRRFASKIGLVTGDPQDEQRVTDLLALMRCHSVDFTSGFATLDHLLECDGRMPEVWVRCAEDSRFVDWLGAWRQRIGPSDRPAAVDRMRQANPLYVARNHLVEAAIESAEEQGDYSVFLRLLEVVTDPYTPRADRTAFARPPLPVEKVTATYCNT